MFSRHQLRLLILGVVVVTASTQPVFLLGAAFFQIGPEFGVGPIGLGVLTAIFFLTASASSLVLGGWVQRVGWRRAMRVNAVVSALIMVAIALVAASVWVFGLLLAAAAAVYGSSNPAANLALAEHTDPHHAATVFGIKHAGIPMSTLLAGLTVPALVLDHGWRAAFVLGAAVAVGVLPLVPIRRRPVTVHPVGAARGAPLTRRRLAVLGAVAALGAVSATALGTYLVSAAIDEGFTESAAGWLQFAGSGVSIVARLVVGVVTDRWRLGGLGGMLALMGSGAVVFGLLPLTGASLFAVAVVAAYATGWAWPGLMTFTVVDANRGSAAASTSITQAGVFVGAGGGPLLLGTVAEHAGFDAVWLVVAMCLVFGSALLVWVRRS